MSRSSRAGETVPFFKYSVFYNRKTTFFPQTATWPALAPKSSRDLPDTSQRAPQEPQRFHVRYLIHPLIGLSLIEDRISLIENRIPLLHFPSCKQESPSENKISLLGSRVSLLENRISLLENRISLLDAYTKILKWPFKILFGHNLHYMAPFAIPNTGFCMFFQRASFVFSSTGAFFWAQDQILGSWVNILAREPFLD